MHSDPRQRLKDLDASDEKIAALEALLDGTSLTDLLDSVESRGSWAAAVLDDMARVKAHDDYVSDTRYERTSPMPAKPGNPSVAREGDLLDQAIEAADLRVKQADRVYDLWRSQGIAPALQLVARYKAAPGMATIEVPAAQVAALGGPAGVAQLIARAATSLADGVMEQAAGTAKAGTLRSDEKPPVAPKRTKAHGGIAHLYDEAIKELNR